MGRLLLLFLMLGCQSTESKLQNALEREYGKGVTLVSYRMVGDNFLDTVRLWKVQAEWDYFEKMARIKGDQAKSHAQLMALSGATGMSSLGVVFKQDALKYAEELKLYIDSLEMMIRADSVVRQRITSRVGDEQKFFSAKGILMTGDSVWQVYDKDMRVVKVAL